jgi:hypothetical protein
MGMNKEQEAISEGVYYAFTNMLDSMGPLPITRGDALKAIEEGTYRAVLEHQQNQQARLDEPMQFEVGYGPVPRIG